MPAPTSSAAVRAVAAGLTVFPPSLTTSVLVANGSPFATRLPLPAIAHAT